MRMEFGSSNGVNGAHCNVNCNTELEDISYVVENGVMEPTILSEMLMKLDIDLAYFHEKLVNLDVCMTRLFLGDSRIGKLSKQMTEDISEVELENAMIVDLLFGYLDCEVTELLRLLDVQKTKIVDAHRQIYCCRQQTDGFYTLQQKLHSSESSWKHLQQKLCEMKQHLDILHRNLSDNDGFSTACQLEDESIERSGFDLQTARMLEKYISSELDLEKRLLRSKEREEELKMSLASKDGVVSNMEAFAEVALKRLLMAEHSSDIYMGTSKEMISRIQILQYKLHCSVQREEELKYKLQNNLTQIESNNAEETLRCQNIATLEAEVKLLKQKLKSLKSIVNETNASYEASQEHLFEMENAVQSLREHVFMAENRAHDAETKVGTLTEENMELREEVEILKGGGESNEERMSFLEKQVRDLEGQLNNARTSSEASLEQQNMLYRAIWDMETLIEELKSKVLKNECRADKAEEQSLVLAETNLELSKEMNVLKSKNENLERSLMDSNKEKAARVKEINSGTKLITEMMVQLALERERIQKQLSSLARENKLLLGELKKVRNNVKAEKERKADDGNDLSCNEDKLPNCSRATCNVEKMAKSPASVSSSNQVDDLPEEKQIDEGEVAGSYSTSDDTTADIEIDFVDRGNQSKFKGDRHYKSWIFAALLILLVSILAVNIMRH